MASHDRGIRDKGKSIFSKFAETIGLQKEDKPKPPPRPSHTQSWKPNSEPIPSENLTSAFSGLSISNAPSQQSSPSTSGFVGGFNPTFPVAQGNFYVPQSPHTSGYAVSSPNFQSTITMPTPYSDQRPQSLTMQMALQPALSAPQIQRPHSNPSPSSNKPPGNSKQSTPQSISARPPKAARPTASPLTTPTKPSKSDPSNNSSAASPKPGQEQCHGQTKAGNRCNRMIKVKSEDLISEDGDEPIQRFCFQHQKEILGQSGYYTRLENSLFVEFEDWIPAYLQPETQASLRAEMDKPRSNSDVHGYIYTFEIRESREGETIKLKVGRAVNLNKRIDQWGKQCGSKEQILRGFYPAIAEDEDGHPGSLMKGRVKAGAKAPWCHRLERLIHLELTDLVNSAVYLDPAWPNVDSGSTTPTESKTSKSKQTKAPCIDCNTMHKEIFEFQRWPNGPYQGKEWDKLVKPVIERWGKYVELYL